MNRSNISLVGNTTVAQNLGGCIGIYKGKVNTNDLQFRSLSGGSGIVMTLSEDKNTINLFSVSGGSTIILNEGITGATSLGSSGATGVYKCTNDYTCHQYFKSLSGGSGISISSDANTINICSTNVGNITGGTNGLSTCGSIIALGGILTGNTIFDGTGSNYNLKYGGDYSANFTAHSLPDISWITGNTGTITDGTNGLCTSVKSIKLGGSLTENTTINTTPSFALTICGTVGGTPFFSVSDTCDLFGNGHHVQLNSCCETNIWGSKVINLGRSTSPYTQCININFNCAAVITDSSPTCQGLIYADDYSAYYTCLSIPHVGWITGHTGSTTGGITGATSLGTGTGVYTNVSDCNLQFKSLSGGSGISISSDANIINICSTSLGSITGGTNGLSTSGKNIKLGGALTGNTSLTGAYTLNICNGAKLNTTCGYQISGTTIFDVSRKSIRNINIGCSAGNSTGTGLDNIAIGYGALLSNTIGCNNTAIGNQALRSNTIGINNIANGCSALYYNTCGCDNIANGFNALNANITGCGNIANGNMALASNSSGCNNIANGCNALNDNTTGSDNIALGYQALYSNTTGCDNIGISICALASNTIGFGNIALGINALASNTTGAYNMAIGSGALQFNTTACNNVALGMSALNKNTSGVYNMAIGQQALCSNTSGIGNIAIGAITLKCNSTGNDNVGIGTYALCSNTTGSCNIATGRQALGSNTTGCNNIALGFGALFCNTTGNDNIANGNGALYFNVSGSSNIALGNGALYKNTGGTNNIGIGCKTLYWNATGVGNIAFGHEALGCSTNSSRNTAFGCQTLYKNLGGTDNFANGYQALYGNKTGNNNIAIGYSTLNSNTGGTNNIAMGCQTLQFNTSGSNNIAMGYEALYKNTTGSNNIVNGSQALFCNTTGSNNIAIGCGAGYFETGSSKLYISNSCTVNPLIHGDFTSKCITIHGRLAITGVTTCSTAKTALVWDSGTTVVHGYPIIEEWVSSISGLTYTGQKFAYPTQTIMQTDIGTCVTIPNYIQICNINLKTVADTLIFTIPAGKTALLNRAKLIILNNASPTCFSISIGNNACYISNCSNNNLANLQQISNVLMNETYDLDLSTRHQGVPDTCGSIVYFRVGSGSTSACNLCAHLLVEGFIY